MKEKYLVYFNYTNAANMREGAFLYKDGLGTVSPSRAEFFNTWHEARMAFEKSIYKKENYWILIRRLEF